MPVHSGCPARCTGVGKSAGGCGWWHQVRHKQLQRCVGAGPMCSAPPNQGPLNEGQQPNQGQHLRWSGGASSRNLAWSAAASSSRFKLLSTRARV